MEQNETDMAHGHMTDEMTGMEKGLAFLDLVCKAFAVPFKKKKNDCTFMDMIMEMRIQLMCEM